MLFDEKKQPYHLMLQKFLALGGQEALFESFRWALTSGGQLPSTKGIENDAVPGTVIC
jgi:E3 ubiquitin-protein ligase HUWE1